MVKKKGIEYFRTLKKKKGVWDSGLWKIHLRWRGHQSLLFPSQWCLGVGVEGAAGNGKTTLTDSQIHHLCVFITLNGLGWEMYVASGKFYLLLINILK